MRVLSFAVLLGWSTSILAQTQNVLYSTDFIAPTYSNGGLIGQDGWVITGTSVVNALAVTNSATTGNVLMANNGQDVQRPFTPAVTSGSVFFQTRISVSAAQATGDYPLHFTDGSANNFYARTYFRSSGLGFTMAMGTSSGAAVTYGTTVLDFNRPYTVLARYDFVAGAGNDTGALFIDPISIDGSSDTPYVNATTIGTDAVSISALGLRQGTAANAPTLDVNSFSAFTITPIPEPTALLGLVTLCVLAWRRGGAQL